MLKDTKNILYDCTFAAQGFYGMNNRPARGNNILNNNKPFSANWSAFEYLRRPVSFSVFSNKPKRQSSDLR